MNTTLRLERRTLACFSEGLSWGTKQGQDCHQQRRSTASWWRPHGWGTWYSPKHLQAVYRATLNTRDLVICFTSVKRCLLRRYMGHWSVVPVKRISSPWKYFGEWSISPLLPFVSSAASVGRTRFWSLWTCLSSEDHPQWEIVLSSMPLSTIRFRPGKVCVVVFGCYRWIQTCT